MTITYDLFGDPIPEGFGKRGRPPHIPTAETRLKVILLMAVGRKDSEIALALGISEPTMRKHYGREMRSREEAKFRLEATRLMKLHQKVEEGNVAAIKEMGKVQERAEIDSGPYAFRRNQAATEPKKQAKLGKKEQADIAANSPSDATPMGKLMAQRQEKLRLN